MSKIKYPTPKPRKALRPLKRKSVVRRRRKSKVKFAPKPIAISYKADSESDYTSSCNDSESSNNVKTVKSQRWEKRIMNYLNRLKRFCGLKSKSNNRLSTQDSKMWNDDLRNMKDTENPVFNSIKTLQTYMLSDNVLDKKQAYKIVETALNYGLACGVVRKIGSGYKCLSSRRNYNTRRKRKDYSAAKTVYPRSVCTGGISCRCYKCEENKYRRKSKNHWSQNGNYLKPERSISKRKRRMDGKSKSKDVSTKRMLKIPNCLAYSTHNLSYKPDQVLKQQSISPTRLALANNTLDERKSDSHSDPSLIRLSSPRFLSSFTGILSRSSRSR